MAGSDPLYPINGELKTDIESLQASVKLILTAVNNLTAQGAKIMPTLDDILANDQSLLASFNQLKTDLEKTISDLQAEITALQGQVDTTKLQQILDDQTNLLNSLKSLDSEAVADDPNQPAPTPPPSN